MFISDSIKYIGVNDNDIDLFEGHYIVPNGIAYNSYVIMDDKIAVCDSVDATKCDEWLNNLDSALDGKTPDYLIVHHMEPDHSGSIVAFMEKYKNATIVSSQMAFIMMKNFFKTDFADRRIIVKKDTVITLGSHVLSFIEAPMVHWPEVIMSYEQSEKILFSADAFGKFGAIGTDEDWACEARRYYFGIVGKFGPMVQSVLEKVSAYQIEKICPLHGPVLSENLGYYLSLYNTWSSYGVESEGVVIAYTSVYGNTKKAVETLAKMLEEKGEKVVVNDLARCDMAEAVEDAFRYGKIVFATTTYNTSIFPYMREFISSLTERNFCNKTVAFIENGSWVPMAKKVMQTQLCACKNLTYCTHNVTIRSSLSEENEKELALLAQELTK